MKRNLEVELLGRDFAPFGGVGLVDELDREDGARRVEGSGFLDAGWILTLVNNEMGRAYWAGSPGICSASDGLGNDDERNVTGERSELRMRDHSGAAFKLPSYGSETRPEIKPRQEKGNSDSYLSSWTLKQQTVRARREQRVRPAAFFDATATYSQSGNIMVLSKHACMCTQNLNATNSQYPAQITNSPRPSLTSAFRVLNSGFLVQQRLPLWVIK